jgi:hypothetical protein
MSKEDISEAGTFRNGPDDYDQKILSTESDAKIAPVFADERGLYDEKEVFGDRVVVGGLDATGPDGELIGAVAVVVYQLH